MEINTNIIIKNKYYILASLLIIIVLVFFNGKNINKEAIATNLSKEDVINMKESQEIKSINIIDLQ